MTRSEQQQHCYFFHESIDDDEPSTIIIIIIQRFLMIVPNQQTLSTTLKFMMNRLPPFIIPVMSVCVSRMNDHTLMMMVLFFLLDKTR